MPVRADAPDFDRPGAGFATSVLPQWTFALEQGLPTYQRQNDVGLVSSQYTADTLWRMGLGGITELQVGGSLWNQLYTHGIGPRTQTEGRGDSSLALKVAPLSEGEWTWAMLGQVTFADGDRAFTNGARKYSFGVTGQWKVGDTAATTLYLNVDRLRGKNTWTLAPNFNFQLSKNLVGYVETDLIRDPIEGDEVMGGGGFALMLGERTQLDAHVLHRLGTHGPDIITGLGISVFFGPVK
jgi:Putative MetA-pathway of phenol degradation